MGALMQTAPFAEDGAFEELELRPRDWAALEPLPLLENAVVVVRRDHLEAIQAALSISGATAFLRRMGELGRGSRAWGLARHLLAWHLASHLDRAGREGYFQLLREVHRCCALFGDLSAAERDLRRLVDDYLPAGSFSLPAEGGKVLPPTTQEVLPWLPQDLWWALLAAPLVELGVA